MEEIVNEIKLLSFPLNVKYYNYINIIYSFILSFSLKLCNAK